MNQKISILSADLASQIAAGEVVERPASVAKELIENALDAGATRIELEIVGGGLQGLTISDNGHGIREAELPLALQRHATSKLRAFDELEGLLTYGFRGEALPSIASVSRLQIQTRHRSEETGVRLLAEGTTDAHTEPVGHPIGTTIQVADLFFNVPARRKFLRSANTESGHIGEVLLEAALCRADVSFQLKRDGKITRKYPRAESRDERVRQILNAESLLHLNTQKGPCQIEALFCAPENARRGTQGLRWVINGRPVKDRALSGSVAHAFRERLERGFYPKGVVYLDLPGQMVDINVHPQKTEVRFSNLRAISEAIHSLVLHEVEKKWPLQAEIPNSQALSSSPPPMRREPATPLRVDAQTSKPQLLKEGAAPPSGERYARSTKGLLTVEPVATTSQRKASQSSAGRSTHMSHPLNPQKSLHATSIDRLKTTLDQNVPTLRKEKTYRNLRFRYQARATFLVCENDAGLTVLHQQLASEAILMSQLSRALDNEPLISQRLLFPQSIELPDSTVVTHHQELLLQLGIDLRVRDEEEETNIIATLHSMPELLKHIPSLKVIETFIHWCKENASPTMKVRPLDAKSGERQAIPLDERHLSLIRQLATLAALRVGTQLKTDEAQTMLRELGQTQIDITPLEKRLIVSEISWKDLERKAAIT